MMLAFEERFRELDSKMLNAHEFNYNETYSLEIVQAKFHKRHLIYHDDTIYLLKVVARDSKGEYAFLVEQDDYRVFKSGEVLNLIKRDRFIMEDYGVV